MCLNCGCGMDDNTMGNDDNLTLTSLAKAAIASEMSAEDTLTNTKETLENITPEDLQKKIEDLKAQG